MRLAERIISILKYSEKGRLEMAFISIFLHFDALRLRLYLRLPEKRMWHEFSVLREIMKIEAGSR